MVKPHGKGIQIKFKYEGKWRGPTLKLPPTATNLKFAKKLRLQIIKEISLGTFNFREHFPGYRFASELPRKPTFREVADLWLKTNAHLAYSSKDSYRHFVAQWNKLIGDKEIDDIKYSDLAVMISGMQVAPVTRQLRISTIKRIFGLARADGIIQKDPTELLKAPKGRKTPPDPYTVEEVEVLLAKMRERFPEHVNYFEFCVFTGARPSEVIALEWDSVDLRKGMVRFDKARVIGVDKDSTKTGIIRDVELCPRTCRVLRVQRESTGLQGKRIFPYHDLQAQGRAWRIVHKLTGIRYRVPYETRHTHISWCLMIGQNILYVAEQHGHSANMMLSTYAKWMKGGEDVEAIRLAMGYQRKENHEGVNSLHG